MIQLPANLAQRILDAARIAVLLHEEQDARRERHSDDRNAGGAGMALVGDDVGGQHVKDDLCFTDFTSPRQA